jgi:transcriptional regulator with XRE-family HTH domain
VILNTKLKELIEEYQEKNRKPDGSKPSQVEIAVNAGVNPSTLSRYMYGHTESYNREVMGKLAKYLGIEDAGLLFTLDEEAN